MSELPPVIERELGRWARELDAGDGGLLMIAVGRSTTRRRAVEDRLGQLLEDWEVAPASVGGDQRDPWAALRGGGGQTLVSLAGVFEGDEVAGTLAALNLGREYLHSGGPSLILWVGAMDNLDRLQRKAPDLWSYRRRVGWFLSVEDFEAEAIEVDDAHDIDARIAGIRARLDHLRADDPRRVELLLDLEWCFDARGEHGEQLRILRELATSIVDERGREVLLARQAGLATRLERLGEALEWAQQIGVSHSLTAANWTANGHEDRARWADAHELWQLVRDRFPPAAIMFANEAELWGQLGQLARAARCCDEAERHLPTSRRQEIYDASFIAKHRAALAIERLDTCGALGLLEQARLLARRAHSFVNIESITHALLTSFRKIGLLDEAEQLCTDALVETPSTREATALRHQLVEIQACRDLDRARQTRARVLTKLDAQLATGPAWQRALVRRERVALLRLELGEPVDREACLEDLDRLIYDALDQRQYDLAQWARIRQVELDTERERFDRARSIATIALHWSVEHEGPSRHAERHLDLARLYRAQADLDAAAAEIATAEQLLSSEDPLYQPKQTWKQLLVERHELALARDGPPAALAALERGLSLVREAGVRALELELLHHLAELPDHPDTDLPRKRAARETLELARDAMLVFEEARALANLALIELALAPERARRLLAEARFLAPLCPLEPADARMRLAEQRLAET